VYVRRHGVSIIHTSDRPRDAFVCVLLGRLTGATCIVHVHVGYNPAWMRGSLQRSIHRANALIAVSCFVGDTLVHAGCDPASVFVVHNGIDLEKWEPGLGRARVRTELGLDERALVVLTVCRLFPGKGTSELVRAFHDAGAAALGATLLVVGTEMEEGYLEQLRADVHRFGIEDRVRFLGHRSDVSEVMAAADVFAMPSQFEPFGLVFAEAMAMELPVVALANGGSIEIVDHGVTGLLCAPGDADELAESLRVLLGEPAKRSELGRRGRQRVEELFTTQHMVARVAEVYTLIQSDQH
jgi:glycosyltransferase involved in cell wall biosynthesis